MPPANRTGDQFDTLVVVRHKPVLEDSLKPSRLCRVSGRNGGQFIEFRTYIAAPMPVRCQRTRRGTIGPGKPTSPLRRMPRRDSTELVDSFWRAGRYTPTSNG